MVALADQLRIAVRYLDFPSNLSGQARQAHSAYEHFPMNCCIESL
jgi:hypothetical protein